jgi:crotonobetainyl-CoA:carnitine CoA-transferase CaiB-like acyl-CoA transferase
MVIAALGEILAAAGLPPPGRGQVEIAGHDPVFPTRFRVGTAGAAAIAATALAAAELRALRNGRPSQKVAVDLRHAAASLRSARYLRIDDKPPKELFDAVSGLYQTRDDRWVFLHCNFPNHRQAALTVLGLSADSDRAAVAAAVRAADGPALEDAIHAAAGCAALVRSGDEWTRHPQAVAVAGLPFLEIERIGDAPPEPLPASDRPLGGIRVLDLTRVLAGPTAARTLAEHGADVLKISAPHLPHSGEVEIDTGLGKLSTFLDLRNERDAATLGALIGEGRCDVFSQSYRPGALAGRGFGPAQLAALRPGIICVELSAWGRAGPWARRRGLRHDRPVRERHGDDRGRRRAAAPSAGLGDRLCQRPLHGPGRDGRAQASRGGRRQLARARLPGPERPMDRQSRTPRRRRDRRRAARAASGRNRRHHDGDAVTPRPDPSSRARRPHERDAGTLGAPAVGARPRRRALAAALSHCTCSPGLTLPQSAESHFP